MALKSYNVAIFWILIILAISYILIVRYTKYKKDKYEGFQQEQPFVLKQNADIYDVFYAEAYDDILKPENLSDFAVEKAVELVDPNKNNSRFLCVGSGTGSLLNDLSSRGYLANGIDKSEAMVNVCQKKYPEINVKLGDVLDPMQYSRALFTHILCVDKTIYEIEDKLQFFKNCYFWMVANGYLILHVVDPDKFDPLLPGGKPMGIDNPQKYGNRRITDVIMDFTDFTYKSAYDFSDKSKVIRKETFKDKVTNNVRENELILNMEPANDILLMAIKAGFVVKGKISLEASVFKDANQYFYILERTM